MKILYLSSWWPTALYPGAGSFVVDQVKCLEDSCEWNVVHLIPPLERFRTQRSAPILDLPTTKICGVQMPPWGIKWFKHHVMCRSIVAVEKSLKDRFGIPDLIHAHVTLGAGIAGMELSKKWNRPLVITEHTGPFASVLTARHRHSIISTLNQATSVVAVSPFQAEQIREQGVHREISVIGNVVAPMDVVSNAPLSHPVKLLSIGTPCHLKGTDISLDALSMLVRGGGRYQLRIAGGPVADAWVSRVRQLNLQEHVTFLGYVDRRTIQLELAKCDALLHTAQAETFCLAVAEAMLAGKPAIITPCGGPEWFLSSQGIVAKTHSPSDCSDAIANLNEFVRSYDPQAASRLIKDQFSASAIRNQLLMLYSSLI